MGAGALGMLAHTFFDTPVKRHGNAVDFVRLIGRIAAVTINEDDAPGTFLLIPWEVAVAEGGPQCCTFSRVLFEAGNAKSVEANNFVKGINGCSITTED